ncbi:hypothetical protein [Lactobacillus sp.]|uniref:hypothetical protein n=1 Tax=Lactobacillus sp. TaxID=1591 RepID=UPI003F8D14B8
MGYLCLLGVLVIVVGFILGVDTVAVVVISALVSVLVSRIDFVFTNLMVRSVGSAGTLPQLFATLGVVFVLVKQLQK